MRIFGVSLAEIVIEVDRISKICRSGAAQEVSPPSPEPICPMCCKPVFTDRAEGDTRELKAALRTAVKIAKMYHGKIPVLSLSEKSYDAFAEAGKELAEVERMLEGESK
jgi:hypothetical protein